MSRLDDSIANTAYILDSLIALRNIYETGSCNDCRIRELNACEYLPKIGGMVRYNCPFYARGEEDATY